MENIKVRRVTPGDIPLLSQIGLSTFSESFSTGNTEENMREYLEKRFSHEQLAEEVTNQNSEFYFAENGLKVVGYLKLNTGASQTELCDDDALEIERIYVLKQFHGKGVGRLLYRLAVERAQELGLNYVWLGVWEENQKAISFYKKNGFVAFDKHIFKLGDDEQTDIMMKLELSR